MNKLLVIVFSFFLLILSTESLHAQFWKRKKEAINQKHDTDTPKKRKKSRTTSESESKVKTKRNGEFISKKSRDVNYKIKVSKKSNEVNNTIEEKKTLKSKTDRPTRKLRKSKSKSERVANSEGSVQIKPQGTYNASTTDEKVTQKVKKKSLKKQRREAENQNEKVVHSDGPVLIEREAYRKEPGTVYKEDKKGGSKYKSRSEEGAYTMKGISPDKKKKIITQKSKKASSYQGDIALLKSKKRNASER